MTRLDPADWFEPTPGGAELDHIGRMVGLILEELPAAGDRRTVELVRELDLLAESLMGRQDEHAAALKEQVHELVCRIEPARVRREFRTEAADPARQAPGPTGGSGA